MRDTSPRINEIKLTILEEYFISKRLSSVKQITKDSLNLSKIINQHMNKPKEPILLNKSELSSLRSAQAVIAAKLHKMSYMEIFWLKVRIKLSKRIENAEAKKMAKEKSKVVHLK
ncbi:hypothetical protein [Pseudoalteromonas marina]|uniref:Uncharacterized protein n=1 Tax=Pseudoalteromonas marina TaxID=267375 RepID=A0ABT9FGF4_9GAMM|nr:hypothetical protein [Pseudoalteromonas marina]MDP2565864.1 hypothetical protein [Pseudoalteromonas marina]